MRQARIPIEVVRDNTFVPIRFEPITDSANRRYCFTVTPDQQTLTTPLTLQISAPEIYTDGELSIEEKIQSGDIVFNILFGEPKYFWIFTDNME